MTATGPVDPAAGRPAAVIAGRDGERIAAAVLGCPGVAGLHPGAYGATTTLLPGRRVPGVRVVDHDEVAVGLRIGLTARFGEDLTRLGDRVRGVVAAHAPDLPVEVTVADVDTDAAERDDPTAATAAADRP